MNNEKKIWLSVVISAGFVIAFWCANYYFLAPDLGKDGVDDRGTFGDMFGVSTSLFTGLTIIGLIATILLQREDIRIARASFDIQQEELRATREEIKQQNETMEQQRFENTFFNLIPLFRGAFDKATNLYSFNNILSHFQKRLNQRIPIRDARTIYQTDQNINFYRHHLNRVCMNIFNKTIELITTENEGFDSDRKRYLGILFSQLSEDEKLTLYYHLLLNQNHPLPYFYQYQKVLFEGIGIPEIHKHYIEEGESILPIY